MALKAGYKGFKKLLSPLKLFKPGELGIDQDALLADLNPVFFTRSEQSELGAVNLVPTNSTATTTGGLTFTKNDDDSVTIAPGTATETIFYEFDWIAKGDCAIKPNTQFYLSGCPSGGSQNGYRLDLRRNPTDAVVESCYGDEVAFTINDTQYAQITAFHFVIRIGNGTVIASPITFKPMVALASNTPYATFAKTNKQLTDAIANISTGWDYSTSEVDTGQKWIDGRPIYCRVIALEAAITASQGSWTSTGVSSAGVDVLLNVSSAADACTNLRGSNKVGTTEEFHVQSYYGNITVSTVIVYYLKTANREAAPEEEPAAKKTTTRKKSTATADNNE